MRQCVFIFVVTCSLLAPAGSVEAQSAPQSAATAASTTTPILRNWTRVESWRFFEPPPGGGDPDYTFTGNRLLAGVRHSRPRLEATAAIQYVQLLSLPDRASGPGAFGSGATYFDHAREQDPGRVYVRLANVQFKSLLPGLDVRAGRMGYASGAEAASGDAAIESVKRMRLDSRLVGEFEWSMFQRAFDGVRVDWDNRRAIHVTGSALWPTQGGFEPKAGASLEDVRILGSTLNVRPTPQLRRTELQAFFYDYDDTRPITGRPDNTGIVVTRADVGIRTFGGSLVGAYPSGRGRFDLLGWVAIQRGDWYESEHDAWAFASEAGHQWTSARWTPWIRFGWNRASGDDDPFDDAHGTFMPLMPTARKYSQSTVYTFMNLDDLFVQGIVRPHPRVSVRADLHSLRLADSADRWYAGSGATRRDGAIFGYAGRRSGGATRLGTVMEGSVDVTLHRRWSVNGYLGHIRAGDVVRTSFRGDALTFAYIENIIQF